MMILIINIIYTTLCSCATDLLYRPTQRSVIGSCVHVTTRQQISYAKTAAIVEGRVSATVTVSLVSNLSP